MTTWCYWQGERSAAIDLCLETIARHNRDFELLGPEDVERLGGDQILALTETRSAQVRADLVRLWLLSRFGGQWIDADCIALRRLDMADMLEGGVELAGFGNGAPRHFSNTILAARAGGQVIGRALQQATDLVKRTPVWQKIPYGATGQGILVRLYRRFPSRMRRCERWRYAYIHFRDVARFHRRDTDWNFDYARCWNPNACCYHLTGKGLVPLHSLSRDQILASPTFAGFLFRRAFGICRPKRAEAIVRRLPHDREIRGVEVGVLRGQNARVLLQQLPRLHLTLVDLWAQQPLDGSYVRSGDAHARKSPAQWERVYQVARRAVAFAGDRVQILRMDSVEAAGEIPDGSLDFVFIDSDHSYEGCRRDLAAWTPKVKRSGWIGGHDYNARWGVKRAVDEWATGRSIERDRDMTWFVRL